MTCTTKIKLAKQNPSRLFVLFTHPDYGNIHVIVLPGAFVWFVIDEMLSCIFGSQKKDFLLGEAYNISAIDNTLCNEIRQFVWENPEFTAEQLLIEETNLHALVKRTTLSEHQQKCAKWLLTDVTTKAKELFNRMISSCDNVEEPLQTADQAKDTNQTTTSTKCKGTSPAHGKCNTLSVDWEGIKAVLSALYPQETHTVQYVEALNNVYKRLHNGVSVLELAAN